MLQFAIKDFTKEVEQALDAVQGKMTKAMNSAGTVLAAELAARIRAMIPQDGGWYDIYRDAIDFIEISPTQGGVAGFAELQFDKVEADKSLVWFQGGGQESQLLGQYNPWAISEIPAIEGGISGDVLVRPASESEVMFHCDRLRSEMSAIKLLMARLNVTVEKNGLPTINGHVMADIDFLIRRLEFGLCGFPRTPIWTKAVVEVEKIADSQPVSDAFNKVMNSDKGTPHGKRNSSAASELKAE